MNVSLFDCEGDVVISIVQYSTHVEHVFKLWVLNLSVVGNCSNFNLDCAVGSHFFWVHIVFPESPTEDFWVRSFIFFNVIVSVHPGVFVVELKLDSHYLVSDLSCAMGPSADLNFPIIRGWDCRAAIWISDSRVYYRPVNARVGTPVYFCDVIFFHNFVVSTLRGWVGHFCADY